MRQSPQRPQSASNSNWIEIGRIVGVFGLDGTLKVTPMTDFPERFLPKATIYIDQEAFKIRKSHWHKEQVRITLHAITRIEEAQPLVGKRIQVPITDRPQLEAGEYFANDLVGMAVIDELGNLLGKVDEVVSAPAQDLLSISGMLIPMVKQFILDIDLEARTIKIRLIEGMDGGT